LDGRRPTRILALGLVQRRLRLVDGLLPARALHLPGGVLPRPLALAALPLPFVFESGLPLRRLVNGAGGWLFRLLAARLAGRFRRFSGAPQVGGQLCMLAEGSVRSDGPPENDARFGHGRGDDVWIVAFLCSSLVEEIAIGAPRFPGPPSLTARRLPDRKAQRSLVGLQFSRHDTLPAPPTERQYDPPFPLSREQGVGETREQRGRPGIYLGASGLP